jgi:hypothetical protein
VITPYETPRALCEAVRVLAEPVCGRLTARPFNPFDPNRTAWWLVPSTAQPHHALGRLYFTFDQFAPSSLLCGLHLHKGLDPSLSPVFSSKRGKALLMDASWGWPKFAADLAEGAFEKSLTSATAPLPVPVLIEIDGGYVTEPSEFDPYSDTRIKSDFYRFEMDAAGCLGVGRSERKAFILKLHQAATATALGQSLANGPGVDPWLWLGMFVCARFAVKPLAAAAGHAGEEWDAAGTWGRFLSRLAPWIGPRR